MAAVNSADEFNTFSVREHYNYQAPCTNPCKYTIQLCWVPSETNNTRIAVLDESGRAAQSKPFHPCRLQLLEQEPAGISPVEKSIWNIISAPYSQLRVEHEGFLFQFIFKQSTENLKHFQEKLLCFPPFGISLHISRVTKLVLICFYFLSTRRQLKSLIHYTRTFLSTG